jgi:hypothetical protein
LTEVGVGPLHGRRCRFVVADLWCSLHGGGTRLQLLGELGQLVDGLLIEDIAGEAPGARRHLALSIPGGSHARRMECGDISGTRSSVAEQGNDPA